MFQKLRHVLVKGSFFKAIGESYDSFVKSCDQRIGIITRNLVYSHGKIQNNKLFVMTYDNQFTCNPSYIVSELLRRDANLDIVWVVPAKYKGTGEEFPDGVRIVKRASYEMYEEMANSKVWLDNALNCVWYCMPKKKDQVYINTWHGSLGIKRLSGNKMWMSRAKQCKKKTTYCISNSTFEDNIYRSTFWPTTPIKKFGHARNDIFFDQEAIMHAKEAVYNFFEIDSSYKLFLYAPTFRDDGDTSCYDMDYELLHSALEERFGGSWLILERAHFKNRSKAKAKAMEHPEYEWLKKASSYPDMQQLMAVVDAGCTDYSSWAYDYILTRKPFFIYASDIEKYNTGRGFYYSLEETPFPIARNSDEMYNNVLNFDNTTYLKKVEDFLEEKGCMENGTASSQVADLILQEMGLL